MVKRSGTHYSSLMLRVNGLQSDCLYSHRFVTHLTESEKLWASKICEGFGQRVCGFDVLRCDNGTKSMVIDVNGWSFVKGNDTYYGTLADYLPPM